MLELYHNINSVCAQKVRIALKEKGQEAKEHLLTLQGDQNDPTYLKLNPNGVVPTLVHDGNVIAESSLWPVPGSDDTWLSKSSLCLELHGA
jgi:glutathione S-transferase